MVGITAGDRVILELAEAPRERDVVGAGDVLIAQEQDPVLQQERFDLREERGVARGVRQAHVAELGADDASQWLDLDGAARRRAGCGRSGWR